MNVVLPDVDPTKALRPEKVSVPPPPSVVVPSQASIVEDAGAAERSSVFPSPSPVKAKPPVLALNVVSPDAEPRKLWMPLKWSVPDAPS